MLKPCEKWNARLSAWLDGEANSSEAMAIEQHLAACSACRAAAEVMRCDAQDATAVLRAPTASDSFAARVMGEVGVTKMEEPEAAPVHRSHPWVDWLVRLNRGQWVALIGATASVALVIVVVTLNFDPVSRNRAAHLATPAPEEQLRALGYLNNDKSTAAEMRSEISPNNTQEVASQPAPPPTAPARKPASKVPSPPTSQPTIIPPELNYGLVDKLMIAYTAEMSLRTKTVEQAVGRAELLFPKYDGFILKTEFKRDEKGKATATVNGRVPAGKLGQLLVELDGLGELQARTVNGEDLTAKQLEQIEKLDDLALKQQFLAKIEGRDNRNSVEQQREVAREKGTGLRVEEYKLKNRVTLANVTVKISSPPAKKPDPVKQSASKSFRGLRAFGLWMLTTLLIPLGIWIPVWGPLAVLGIVLRRRYRRRE